MNRQSYPTYQSHFACFDCRKAFKKKAICDWAAKNGLLRTYYQLFVNLGPKLAIVEARLGTTWSELCEQYYADVCRCPECGQAMAAIELDFQAPLQTDVQAWQNARQLHESGNSLLSNASSEGPKARPIDVLFAQHERLSKGRQRLENSLPSKTLSC